MRLDPVAVAEADIALVMINDRQRPVAHQLPAFPSEPPLVAAVQADADQVVAGPVDELPHPGHVGLGPAGARQETVERRHRLLEIAEHLLALAFEHLGQAEQGAEGVGVRVAVGHEQRVAPVPHQR